MEVRTYTGVTVELDGFFGLDVCYGVEGLLDGIHGDDDLLLLVVLVKVRWVKEAESIEYKDDDSCLRLSGRLALLPLCFCSTE